MSRFRVGSRVTVGILGVWRIASAWESFKASPVFVNLFALRHLVPVARATTSCELDFVSE